MERPKPILGTQATTSKTSAAGTMASKDSTAPANNKLAKAVENVKIEDQEPAEAKQAGDSVED
jgi:hypothetical protein